MQLPTVAPTRNPSRNPDPHHTRRWAHALGAAVLAVVHVAALAQQPGRELLNSERIAERFGNYGIEVLTGDGQVRVSNLFSTANGVPTCRTFAVVRFPSSVDPIVATEHAAIMAGGSIGAVFATAGWEVRKSHLFYGDVEASAQLARLMEVPAGTRLAQHAYVLDVVRNGRTIEYAALVEIHHPDYLVSADLQRIYGTATLGERAGLLAALLATAAERTMP